MILPKIPTIHRLSIKPDDITEEMANDPRAVPYGARPGGSRQPHADSTVALVRRLIEQTTLTHAQIEAKTGVNHATISVWKRNFGWKRPPFAPRSPDMVPLWRAGPGLKLRKLAERLLALAERMTRELEETPGVDTEKLVQALQVVKMARLATQRNHRRRPLSGCAETGHDWWSREEAIRGALKEMHRGGVDIDRAPQEALDLVIDANTPVEKDHPALRERRAKRR
jgi:hypothetical protein